MFAHRYFPAYAFAPTYFPPVSAGVAPPAATGSKGRRLVRWLIEMPIETNMLGEYVWQREEEDEIFILF